jgi:phage tail sheath protein FI
MFRFIGQVYLKMGTGCRLALMNNSAHKIQGVPSIVAGFVGVSPHASPPHLLHSFGDYQKLGNTHASAFMNCAIRGFFENGGTSCYIAFTPLNALQNALDALAKEKISLLACPDQETFPNAPNLLVAHCEKLRDRICVLHAPAPIVNINDFRPPVQSSFAAFYHPWLEVPNGTGHLSVPPDGHVLGTLAHADATKLSAQAGAALRGVSVVSQTFDSVETETLNSQRVNVLRFFAGKGNLVWGALTTSLDPEWKYISVRRLAIFVEHSIQSGLQWAVFEPNGQALWATVRPAVNDFLLSIWRQSGLQGSKPEEAFFVRCDAATMTAADIASGNLVVVVGIAPVKPAEFVIIQIGQLVKPGIS